MKKAILSINEKHERITIRYKSRRKRILAVCEDCGKQFDWLTVNEAARLSGSGEEEIKRDLKTLRSKNK